MDVYALLRHIGCTLVILVLCTLQELGHAQRMLYYASPGDSRHQIGIWAGIIDPRNDGRAKDLHMAGIQCAAMPQSGYYSELFVQAMSHDPLSQSVVIQLIERSPTRVSVIKVPLCQEGPVCNDGIVDVLFSQGGNNEDPQWAKLGPFAMWNKTVYFVAQRYRKGHKERSMVKRMEIRKLIDNPGRCKLPYTKLNRINLDVCSEFVALVVEEYSDKVILEMRDTLVPSNHLFVTERQGRTLEFILQITNNTEYEDKFGEFKIHYSMNLMTVEEYSPFPATTLHEEHLPVEYTWYKHVLDYQMLGGISYRNGILCWTVTDRILCGNWDPTSDHLTKVTTVLKPGQARAVCTESKDEPIVNNVTTGVAIADTKNGLQLYFGCYAGAQNVGGAGLLKLHSDWSVDRLFNVMEVEEKIYAGSMFVDDICPDLFPQKDSPQGTPDSEEPKTESVVDKTAASSASHSITHVSGLMCSLVLIISWLLQ